MYTYIWLDVNHFFALHLFLLEKMTFNPWNTQDFKPIGAMKMIRKQVYDQSAATALCMWIYEKVDIAARTNYPEYTG